jgi:hypothetical protein
MPFTLNTIPEGDNLLAHFAFEDTFLEACEISINQSDYQPLLWSPYTCTVSRDTLNEGSNTINIRVYTSLIRSFEGQTFDHETHSYHDIGITEDTKPTP